LNNLRQVLLNVQFKQSPKLFTGNLKIKKYCFMRGGVLQKLVKNSIAMIFKRL